MGGLYRRNAAAGSCAVYGFHELWRHLHYLLVRSRISWPQPMTDALHALRSQILSTIAPRAAPEPAHDSMLLVCAAPDSIRTLTRSLAHQELQKFGAVHTIEHAPAPLVHRLRERRASALTRLCV